MRRNAQILDIPVLGTVPPQVHVVPLQLQPDIRDQQLILLVLWMDEWPLVNDNNNNNKWGLGWIGVRGLAGLRQGKVG